MSLFIHIENLPYTTIIDATLDKFFSIRCFSLIMPPGAYIQHICYFHMPGVYQYLLIQQKIYTFAKIVRLIDMHSLFQNDSMWFCFNLPKFDLRHYFCIIWWVLLTDKRIDTRLRTLILTPLFGIMGCTILYGQTLLCLFCNNWPTASIGL